MQAVRKRTDGTTVNDSTPGTVIDLRAPMGLGWRRHLGLQDHHPFVAPYSHGDPSQLSRVLEGFLATPGLHDPLVLTAVDQLPMGLVAEIAPTLRLLATHHRIVLCSASAPPDELSELCTQRQRTAPVSLADFERLRPDQQRPSDAWIASGGWPEAIGTDAHPSASHELTDFTATLWGSWPGVNELTLLAAVSHQGLPPEVLSSLMGIGLGEVLRIAEEAQSLGLLGRRGTLLVPTVPLVAECLAGSETGLRAAAARVASDALARELGLAAVPAVITGLELDHDLRTAAIKALEAAEATLDTYRWRRTATVFSTHHDEAIRSAGLTSLTRLAAVRGDRPPLLPAEVDDDRRITELYRQTLNLEGLSPAVLADEEAALFLGDDWLDHFATPITRATLSSVRGDLAGAQEWIGRIEEPARRVLPQWLAAFLAGDRDRALDIEVANASNPHLGIFVVFRYATEGRFALASRRLTALAGSDWRQLAPLFQYLAMYVAAGSDVEKARHMLASVQVTRPRQLGSLLVSFARARAELVSGNSAAAAQRAVEILDHASDSGLTRPVRAATGELLSLISAGGDLTPVCSTEAAGDLRTIVLLARCLERERLDSEEARELMAQLPTPYQRSHCELLLGDRLRELGDETGAAQLIESAWRTFTSLGAPVDAGRARGRMRLVDRTIDRGSHTEFNRGPVGGARGVTGREQQVLELVERGLTNREIAATLNLSPSTVKHHVASLLRRYEAHSRRDLVRVANEAADEAVGPVTT